jgi:hypothetical protein
MQAMNNRHGSLCDNDFDPQVRAWMETHTVGDLKNLAREMESKGENIIGIMETVQALEEIELGQLPRMGDS